MSVLCNFVYLKMQLPGCVFMSILLMIADGFTVKGPSGPLVVPLGASVLLPCSVDSLSSMEDLEVQWRRSDSETLVHLYQDGDIRPEVQQQEYHDRAHFFIDNIKHGNFSLLLENVRAEDEGEYTCKVYSGHDSAETVVEIKCERLIVSGSNGSISVFVGEDVTLSCSVDSHIPPEEIEEVSWKKTDKDGDLLVLLYQNNESLSELSHDQYRDRVEFFTDEIHRGNFSLRLKSVRTEDKGVYMCQVFAGELSANTTVVLEQLGFSALHIMVLILCITACGSALLICCLIYCRSNNTDSSGTVWNLQISLVLCPNICVFFAFIFWGVTEGFLNESITCCALYILRPVMLIWAVRYLKYLQDTHKTWIRFTSIPRELAVFTIIVYSVFFARGWKESAHNTSIVPRVIIGIWFGVVVLLCLIILSKALRKIKILVVLLSLFQTCQLTYSYKLTNIAVLYVVGVQLLLILCLPCLSFLQQKCKVLRRRWIRLTIMLLDIPLAIYVHLSLLEKEEDYLGWICVILFIQLLKMIVFFEDTVHYGEKRQRNNDVSPAETSQQGSSPVPLCDVILYMFGAVGLIFLNSVALTAELILKARNGDRVIKDLRVIVFPSECVFASYWLVLQVYAFWKLVGAESIHNQNNLHQRDRHDLRNTQEGHEMKMLFASDTGVSQTH